MFCRGCVRGGGGGGGGGGGMVMTLALNDAACNEIVG